MSCVWQHVFRLVFCMFGTSHDVEKMPRRRFNRDQPGNAKLRFMFFPAVIECITWQMKSRELTLSELRMATRVAFVYLIPPMVSRRLSRVEPRLAYIMRA